MTAGDIRTLRLRLSVSKANVGIGRIFLFPTGLDISLFTIAGIEKTQSTGKETAEYIVSLVLKA